MSLQDSVMTALKTAMKSKDTVALTCITVYKICYFISKNQWSGCSYDRRR